MTGDFNALIEETYCSEAVGSEYVVITNTTETFFKTAEEAVRFAAAEWDHLSKWDKKRELIEAVRIEWELFDGMAMYEQYETAWSSAAEGRAPSGATSAFVHVRVGQEEHSIGFGMHGEYFDADHAFYCARAHLADIPASSVCIEFFRDDGDEFDELGIIEVV